MNRLKALVVLIAALMLALPAMAEELNLVDLMDTYYGSGNWTYRTGVGTGSDIGPALSAGLTQLRSSQGRGIIKVPAGHWLYTTAVSPSLLSGNYIVGEGSQASVIVYNANYGGAFYWSGYQGYSGGGMRGIAILLEKQLGDTNAYALLVQGDATYQSDQMAFEDIYISSIEGNSYWWAGLQVYGNARTSPQGIRVITIKNMQIFACHYFGAYFSNLVQASIENLGVYSGKPQTTGMDVWLTGGGSASTNSIYVSIDALNVGGAVHLDNISNVALHGNVGSLITGSSATYVSGWLHAPSVTGSVGSNSNLTIQN